MDTEINNLSMVDDCNEMEKVSGKGPASRKPTILYVDDDIENLTSFKSVFRRSYEIYLATSAKEAIEILKHKRILVMITDQRMPEMSGSELLEVAAMEFPGTLRFMLTGFTDYHPLVDAINKGKVHGYFSKPFDADNIRSRIESNLRAHYLELENAKLLKQIRQSERFLDIIVENIPQAICVQEACDGTVIKVNRAVEELLGSSREEIVGKSVCDLFPQEEAASISKLDREVLDSRQAVDIPERKVSIPGKGTRWLHMQKIPVLDEGSNVIFLLSVCRDITQFKSMIEREETLERQLRQVSKDQALGRMASGVAHDFNNMLSPIINYTELMRMDMAEGSPLGIYLDGIQRAALRSKELVNQILTFSRKAEKKVTPMSLEPVIKEAVLLIRSSASPSIRIVDEIDKSCGQVYADPTQIHQIVMNLATNSCHAMEKDGGTLCIELVQVRLENEPWTDHDSSMDCNVFSPVAEDVESSRSLSYDVMKMKQSGCEWARLKVRDTGSGIDSALLERVFDPYFTTKSGDKGTGLGLSVVQGIVKSCDGHISIRSRLGEGTEVTVYLPVVVGTVVVGSVSAG